MTKPLIAVALAGGAGNRFWPLSDKILFPFMGKPLIQHTVLDLLPEEVDKLVIVTNKSNQNLIRFANIKIPVVTIVQPRAKGMADALLTAQSQISSSRLLIFITTHLVEKNLITSVLNKAKQSNAFGVIPAYKTEEYMPLAYLDVNKTGKISRIVEKPGAGKQPSDYSVVTGHYIDDSDILLEELKKTTSDSDDEYEKALNQLMRHTNFQMVKYRGISTAFKYPWNVLDMVDGLFRTVNMNHRGRNVDIKGNVFIEGPVYLGDNVKIFENTKISGPAYIGDNTVIGNNNIIRHSYLGKYCITGFNSDITRSYVGDDCWFHSNYIGDSILEKNISMGSGSVLANLRLDEEHISSFIKGKKETTHRNKLGSIIAENVRIGVNVSVMPGVKIGANSFIGAGSIVIDDIKEDSYVAVRQDQVHKKNIVRNLKSRDVFRKKI